MRPNAVTKDTRIDKEGLKAWSMFTFIKFGKKREPQKRLRKRNQVVAGKPRQ